MRNQRRTEWVWGLIAVHLAVACGGTATPPQMVLVKSNATLGTSDFLIDSFENTVEEIDSGSTVVEEASVEEGATPRNLISYTTAKQLCEALSKRICTYEEWVAACKGAENLKYGFQNSFEEPDPVSSICITGRTDEVGNPLPGVEALFPRPAGEKPNCATSNLGIRDMVGNLSEWVLLDDSAGTVTGSAYVGGIPAGGNHRVRDEQNHCDFKLFRDQNEDGVVDSLFPEDTESEVIGFRCCRDVSR